MDPVCQNQSVSSARANLEQQALFVSVPACRGVLREGGISSLSASQWDCASASHSSAYALANKARGQYGNCLRAGGWDTQSNHDANTRELAEYLRKL